MAIPSIQIRRIEDTLPRERKVCDDCGKRRLCTLASGRYLGSGAPVELYLCNDCLVQA